MRASGRTRGPASSASTRSSTPARWWARGCLRISSRSLRGRATERRTAAWQSGANAPRPPQRRRRAGYSSAVAKEDWLSVVDRVEKPWGFEEHFALVPGKYCGKALHVHAGCALSLQYHEQKEETVAVQSGRLLFAVGLPDGDLE